MEKVRKFQEKVSAPLEDARAFMIESRKVLAKAVAGEFFATLIFLFVVEATATNLAISKDPSGMIVAGVSTAFTAIAVIYSFADVSGAHFNPAVTFGTCVMGKTSWRKGACYVAAQLLGGTFATLFVKAIFPNKNINVSKIDVVENLKISFKDPITWQEAFSMEFLLTFMLVYVIFAVAFDTVDTSNAVRVSTTGAGADGANETDGIMLEEQGQSAAAAAATNNNNVGVESIDRRVGRNLTIYTTSGNTKAGFAPIAIGFTLGYLCFIGGTTSGGAFNPARVFGPAVLGGFDSSHWVYWVADFTGAACAGLLQSVFAHKAKTSSGNNVN